MDIGSLLAEVVLEPCSRDSLNHWPRSGANQNTARVVGESSWSGGRCLRSERMVRPHPGPTAIEASSRSGQFSPV